MFNNIGPNNFCTPTSKPLLLICLKLTLFFSILLNNPCFCTNDDSNTTKLNIAESSGGGEIIYCLGPGKTVAICTEGEESTKPLSLYATTFKARTRNSMDRLTRHLTNSNYTSMLIKAGPSRFIPIHYSQQQGVLIVGKITTPQPIPAITLSQSTGCHDPIPYCRQLQRLASTVIGETARAADQLLFSDWNALNNAVKPSIDRINIVEQLQHMRLEDPLPPRFGLPIDYSTKIDDADTITKLRTNFFNTTRDFYTLSTKRGRSSLLLKDIWDIREIRTLKTWGSPVIQADPRSNLFLATADWIDTFASDRNQRYHKYWSSDVVTMFPLDFISNKALEIQTDDTSTKELTTKIQRAATAFYWDFYDTMLKTRPENKARANTANDLTITGRVAYGPDEDPKFLLMRAAYSKKRGQCWGDPETLGFELPEIVTSYPRLSNNSRFGERNERSHLQCQLTRWQYDKSKPEDQRPWLYFYPH